MSADQPAAPADDAPIEDAPAPEPERLHGALVSESHGQAVVHPSLDAYADVISKLKDDGYMLCSDLCGVDHLANPRRSLPAGVDAGRYEVVVNLTSLEPYRRIRVRVQAPDPDPIVPSLFALFPGTEAMEREAYDLLGIRFDGHPDLTRILLPDDWEGHPLRKDESTGRVPVQFKQAGVAHVPGSQS